MVSELLSVWSTVGSVLLAVLILLVMVTIHEFGHYLAGKLLHFKIDEFSVGFGPALFKHRSKKTGELFALRLIPLGGYCAFAGEDGLEEEERKDVGKEPFDLAQPPAEGPAPSTEESSSSATENTSCPPPASDTSSPTVGEGASCPPPASGKPSCPPPASGGGVGEGGRPNRPTLPATLQTAPAGRASSCSSRVRS